MSTGAQLAWVLLWLVLVTILVAALVVLALSRWGRSKPVRICAVLSLLMHVLLAGYAATIQILTPPPGPPGRGGIDVALVDDFGPDGQGVSASPHPEPWEQFAAGPAAPKTTAELPKAETAAPAPLPKVELPTPPPLLTASVPPPALPPTPAAPPELSPAKLPLTPTEVASIPALIDPPAPKRQDAQTAGPATTGPDRIEDDAAPNQVANSQPQREPNATATTRTPELPDLPPAAANSANLPSLENTPSTATLLGQLAPLPPVAAYIEAFSPKVASGGPVSGGAGPAGVPEPYKARVEGDRAVGAERRGGSPEAEAAVQAGLRWLAEAQSDDGRWEAALYGAGRERRIGGTDRQSAGATADTGMTGLALLAFLGSGNTQSSGKYRDNVRRGLEFLIRTQRSDGSLAGNARVYEAMYCHGIAAFALSEAAAMTRDERLKPAVSRAVTFIVASQHPATGGWRYQPGDPGDTSQLGWQIMALRSAELAGTAIPDRTRDGIQRFLISVSSGQHGGLASYRAGERATRTMTAEALASRQFMRLAAQDSSREAAGYIVQELPGAGEVNLYYWYYATLSMYQLQDEHWERWNEALQKSLLASQHKAGDQAGSWDNDTVWGTYGGRVYTTALSTLCLEVYYRYLPVYAARGRQPRTVR
ncbi:MAG: hypothetical protein K8T91_14410 [Planctomycetes bacterium]|nr:hypothetical protein [Planctomycetota bacterium]